MSKIVIFYSNMSKIHNVFDFNKKLCCVILKANSRLIYSIITLITQQDLKIFDAEQLLDIMRYFKFASETFIILMNLLNSNKNYQP